MRHLSSAGSSRLVSICSFLPQLPTFHLLRRFTADNALQHAGAYLAFTRDCIMHECTQPAAGCANLMLWAQ